MDIINTIVPIFSVIFIGWFAHRKHFFPRSFLEPANRIVFYIAIPAMIFRAVSNTSFSRNFNPDLLAVALISLTLIYLLSWAGGVFLNLKKGSLGSFVQSSSHCNIGYIAFAVAFYYLGQEGLAATGLFAGFIMILQNLYSVTALTAARKDGFGNGEIFRMAKQVVLNPIILSAALGIVFSAAEIPLPVFASRALDILGGMGLPTALLIIGASLSPEKIRTGFWVVAASCFIKLVLLPAISLGLFAFWGISGEERLPILIILASPTATVAYVMAGEMGGDANLAAAVISLCTILSSITFLFWLNMV
ncbi:MAG: AEC family transporter [Desulfobacterales bacterium]